MSYFPARDSIRNLLLEYGASVNDIPQQLLRTAISKSMDALWPDRSLSNAVSETIPYFPLSRAVLKEILSLDLQEMAANEIRRGRVVDLVVDSDVLSFMTSNKLILYQRSKLMGIFILFCFQFC